MKEIKKQQEQLAQRLYETRKALGLTQQEVADFAGIDRKTVNRIENNHFSPNVETLLRLCVVFNTKPATLFQQVGS